MFDKHSFLNIVKIYYDMFTFKITFAFIFVFVHFTFNDLDKFFVINNTSVDATEWAMVLKRNRGLVTGKDFFFSLKLELHRM